MYIIKNAYLNITRKKGRNILIGVIIAVITVGASIALSIHKSGSALVEAYKESNPLEVSFTINPENFRGQRNENISEKQAIENLTVSDIKKYGNSSYVSDYYYSLETAMSAKEIEPVSYTELSGEENDEGRENDRKMSTGDFRITGYSDPSYITEFIEGTKKIKDGDMFSADNEENVLVISEELAENNDLEVGDTIVLYNDSDEETTYEFKIIGIYEDNSEIDTGGFMHMNAMNSRNQMYAPFVTVQKLSTDNNSSNMGSRITAKFYLKNNNDIEAFEKEARSKGLSDGYTVTTNEEEVLAAVKPIQNVSHFSFTFLIIILVVGAVILGVINLINIRERKYEIGVLRAIGMKKSKVALEFIAEIFMVALLSLIIGTGIGMVLSQPVTNAMLASEINSYQTESNQITENFGSGNFQRPAMNRDNKGHNNVSVDYVDSLSVHIDALTILQLFLVSLFLTLTTSVISIIFISRYEPNKILQDR